MNGDSAAKPGGSLTGLRPGSRVAGYLLAGNLAGDQAARERFTREARTVANVEHPHIIPV